MAKMKIFDEEPINPEGVTSISNITWALYILLWIGPILALNGFVLYRYGPVVIVTGLGSFVLSIVVAAFVSQYIFNYGVQKDNLL
jgi:hypothetical protein